MVIQVAKRHKKQSSIFSGLIILMCLLIVLPIVCCFLKLNDSKDGLESDVDIVRYYEVTFKSVCGCHEKSVLVKVGEEPLLPDINCTHKSFIDVGSVTTHTLVAWTYNGQYLTQTNCPAFNTDVVLVADVVTIGAGNVFPFPVEWMNYEK